MKITKPVLLLMISMLSTLICYDVLHASSFSGASYNIEKSALCGSGGEAASTGYNLSFSLGQAFIVGISSGSFYQNAAGLWQIDEEPIFSGVALDLDISSMNYDQFEITVTDIDSTVTAGMDDEIIIAVVAQNVTNLDTYQVEINYDYALIAFVEAYEDNPMGGITNFLKSNGGTTIGFQAVETTPGTVNIANALVGSDPDEAPDGSGIIALIKFRVLSTDCDNELSLSNVYYIDSSGVNRFISSTMNAVVNDCNNDSDNDGLPDNIENNSDCLDPNDADTDDDGIMDGNEDKNADGIVDLNESDPCLPDTDGDGIYDGTEVGLTEPQNAAATDVSAGFFVPDADPSTTTLPYSKDSDGDGIPDGLEDLNRNGGMDACEPDPMDYTTDLLVDMDSDGDVDGADLAEYAQAVSAGTVDLCVEFFSTYMGHATWLPDPDGDGIFSDGDFSGVVGDNPCVGGVVIDCDDNCLSIQNAMQSDTNSNGIGDVCEGLIAYYPLNGNAMDFTLNENHGVESLSGVAYSGNAAIFDGIGGYIEILSNNDLNLKYYTLSAWFNSSGPRGCILAHGESYDEDNMQYSIYSSDNMAWFEESIESETDDYRLSPTNLVHTDEWYFVTVTRDTEGDFKLFIDGELEDSETGTPDPALFDLPVTIGTRYRDGSDLQDFYTGTIDEIRIFNRALTNDEIRELYSTGR